MNDLNLALVLKAEVEQAERALARVQGRLREMGGAAEDSGRKTGAAARETNGLGLAAARASGALLGAVAAIGASVLSLSALARGASRAVQAFSEADRQMRTTQQVIRATGGAAGRTGEDIEAMARAIGRGTLASTDGARAAAAQLLTFRTVSGEVFDRTLVAAQDLAAVGFGTIESAAVQLGKALENPIEGVASLREVGVSFSSGQREVIRSLVETGRVAEAQRVILAAVEQQVGGAGRAAAGGLAGAFDTLGEEMGRWFELVGGRIATVTGLKSGLEGLAEGIAAVNDTLDTESIGSVSRLLERKRAELAALEAKPARGSPLPLDPTALAIWGSVSRTPMPGSFDDLTTRARADIADLEARLDGLRLDAEAVAADAERQSVAAQAELRRQQVEGVIAALEAEAEAAGLTKLEIEGLAAARRAGIGTGPGASEADVAAYAQILALLQQIQAVRAAPAGRALVEQLREEAEMQRLVALYGEDSRQVTEARAAAARRATEAQMEALGISAELREELARALDATDATAAATASWAAAMAGVAAQVRGILAALSSLGGGVISGAAKAAEITALQAGKTVSEARRTAVRQEIEWETGAREAAAKTWAERLVVRADRIVRLRNLALDSELEQARAAAASRGQPSVGGSAGGGTRTRAAGDDLGRMLEQARAAMEGIDLTVAQVNEKVRLGLTSAAEGAEGVAAAKRRAAEALADLIPRLEAMGPAGEAAAERTRAAVARLVPEIARLADGPVRRLSSSFEGIFGDMIAGTRDVTSAFADMGRMILAEIGKLAAQRFIMPLVTPLLDGLFGMFAAQGAVMRGGVQAFAAGGVPGAEPLAARRETILDRPTLFPMAGGRLGMAGEAGEEAIMPVLRAGAGRSVRAVDDTGREGALPLTRTGAGVLAVAARFAARFAAGGVPGAEPLAARRETILDRPTLFPMAAGRLGLAGEAGEEAIMPVLRAGAGRSVRAVDDTGREGALPLTRTGAGVLAVAARFAAGGVLGAANAPLKAVFKTPAAAPGSALAAAPATISAAGPGRAGTGLPAAFRAAAADAGLALSAAAGPLARLAQGLATPALPAWAAAAIAGPPGAARGSADTATGPAASARGRAGNIYVQVDNRAGDAVEATASSRGDGLDTIVEIVVERVRSAMSRDFARGTGAAAALEGAYGLRRAPR